MSPLIFIKHEYHSNTETHTMILMLHNTDINGFQLIPNAIIHIYCYVAIIGFIAMIMKKHNLTLNPKQYHTCDDVRRNMFAVQYDTDMHAFH